MSVANLFVPNNDTLYCGALTIAGNEAASIINVGQSNTLTGAGLAAPAACGLIYELIGSTVTMTLLTTTSGPAGAGGTITFGTNVPTEFLPTGPITQPVMVINNTSGTLGYVTVAVTGAVTFNVLTVSGANIVSSNFGSSGDNGVLGFSMTWFV
jgi:hypothetical protein